MDDCLEEILLSIAICLRNSVAVSSHAQASISRSPTWERKKEKEERQQKEEDEGTKEEMAF